MRKVSFIRAQGATWVATYGSVTFNQFSHNNPMTGINEKGLMVSQMWLDETQVPSRRHPSRDRQPRMDSVQPRPPRQRGGGSGGCRGGAADGAGGRPSTGISSRTPPAMPRLFEFLDGKLVVHRGAAMPVRALTNSTYSDSVAAFERAKAKGEMPKSSVIARSIRAGRHAGGRRQRGPDRPGV